MHSLSLSSALLRLIKSPSSAACLSSDKQGGLKHCNLQCNKNDDYDAKQVRGSQSTPGKQKHKQNKLMLNLLLSITLLTYYQIAVPVMGLRTATNMLQKQN